MIVRSVTIVLTSCVVVTLVRCVRTLMNQPIVELSFFLELGLSLVGV
jgi:hypothetical protein